MGSKILIIAILPYSFLYQIAVVVSSHATPGSSSYRRPPIHFLENLIRCSSSKYLWRVQNLPIEQWTAATVDQILAKGDPLNLDAYEISSVVTQSSQHYPYNMYHLVIAMSNRVAFHLVSRVSLPLFLGNLRTRLGYRLLFVSFRENENW